MPRGRRPFRIALATLDGVVGAGDDRKGRSWPTYYIQPDLESPVPYLNSSPTLRAHRTDEPLAKPNRSVGYNASGDNAAITMPTQTRLTPSPGSHRAFTVPCLPFTIHCLMGNVTYSIHATCSSVKQLPSSLLQAVLRWNWKALSLYLEDTDLTRN